MFSRCLEQFLHAPNVIRDACTHAGRHPDRGVHSNEVIPRHPERNARLGIRQLAAVRVRAACIASQMHPHREIESFDVACTHKLRVGHPLLTLGIVPVTRLVAPNQSGPTFSGLEYSLISCAK